MCLLNLINLHAGVLGSIVVGIPACHAGDRGSIPRRGDAFFGKFSSLEPVFWQFLSFFHSFSSLFLKVLIFFHLSV